MVHVTYLSMIMGLKKIHYSVLDVEIFEYKGTKINSLKNYHDYHL